MNPHLILNSEAYQGWIVYAWVRGLVGPDGTDEGQEFLYVGSSFKGVSRFANHHIIGKAEYFAPDDKVYLYYCQSQIEAVSLELKLILEKQPRYNTQSKKAASRRNTGLITSSWKDSFKDPESKGPVIQIQKEEVEVPEDWRKRIKRFKFIFSR